MSIRGIIIAPAILLALLSGASIADESMASHDSTGIGNATGGGNDAGDNDDYTVETDPSIDPDNVIAWHDYSRDPETGELIDNGPVFKDDGSVPIDGDSQGDDTTSE